MKIHTNLIGYTQQIRNALQEQKDLGRIAHHVHFKKLEQRGSRSHQFAFEVQLEASERDNGRRAGNSGSYGAMRPEYDGYAATYDEWGWLLAALFALDPAMIVGTPKSPVYANATDFHDLTAWTYAPEMWLKYVNEWPTFADERDPFPIVTGRAANSKRGYMVGRHGANRVAFLERTYWPHKNQPRTVAEVTAFAYPLNSK